MRKKILIVLGVLVAAVALLVLVIALQPTDFRVTRTATVAGAPAEVFAHVNNLHRWEAWSPWAKLDPAAKNTFEGPEEGEGAIFHWSGNEQIGEGNMSITGSVPAEHIDLRLEFIRPFPDVCQTEFTFEPHDDATQVTWTMHGQRNFLGKAICLFMDMDKMVGGSFEEGLANLDRVVKQEVVKQEVVKQEQVPGEAETPPAETASPPAEASGSSAE